MDELFEDHDQQMQAQQENDAAYLHHCMMELRPHLSAELYQQVQQALGF